MEEAQQHDVPAGINPIPGGEPGSPRAQLLARLRDARAEGGLNVNALPVLPPIIPLLLGEDQEDDAAEGGQDQEEEEDDHSVEEEPEVNMELQRRSEDAMEDVQMFLAAYVNARITPQLLVVMDQEYDRIAVELRFCRGRLQEFPAMFALLIQVRGSLAELVVGAVNARARAPQPGPPLAPQEARPRSRSPVGRRVRDRSYDSLRRMESDIEFQLSWFEDDALVDVRPGVALSFEQLRTLNDLTLPQVKEAVKNCQYSLREYSSCGNYNRDLVAEAHLKCQGATKWTSDLQLRCREKKLHLDRNLKHKEITFTAFKPGQGVSIYEFFMAFETWSCDFLAEEAMSDQLFNKYLDSSITESYAEILPLKNDYHQMKQWLIRKYGSVVPMAQGYIKAIAKLQVPKPGDVSGNITHMRTIHRLLTNLSSLELEKGVPVPRLQDHLGSNAFLSALVEVIPAPVRKEISKDLVRQELDDPYSLEGRQHLTAIVNQIRLSYRELEWELATTQAAKPAPVPSQPKKQMAAHVAGTGSAGSPHLTGGNSTPLG